MKEENIPSLFLLVQRLNSSEKSYYKKMSKRHADHNTSLHLRLFKLVDENKIYDEEQLCRDLKISKIHFSGLKQYLYKDILDSLVFEKRNTTINTQLFFLQEQIRILKQKKLLALAEKLCKKAIALSEKYEKHEELIVIYNLYLEVLEYKDYKQYQSNSEEIFDKINAAILNRQLLNQNTLIYNRVKAQTQYSWLRIGSEEISEISDLKERLNSLKPKGNYHPLTSLYYYNSLALCEYMLHENYSCTNTCSALFQLWNQFPFLISENPLLFFNSLNTTCYNNFLCQPLFDQKQNLDAYSKLMEAHVKNDFYRKHFDIIEFNTQLKIYHKAAQYDQVKMLIDKSTKRILINTVELVASPNRLSLMCSICISYFVLEQWDDAEELLTAVKELNRTVNREDILYFSSVFYLLILYEKQEWYQLDYAIEAAYHYLYTRKKFRPFERKLILFLKKLFATPKNEMNILIKQFLEQLDKENALEKQLNFHYFNYYGWLESKLVGMRYMDYNRKQVLSNSAIS
jgi:hypothetical protein